MREPLLSFRLFDDGIDQPRLFLFSDAYAIEARASSWHMNSSAFNDDGLYMAYVLVMVFDGMVFP